MPFLCKEDRVVDQAGNKVKVRSDMWERGHKLDSNPHFQTARAYQRHKAVTVWLDGLSPC